MTANCWLCLVSFLDLFRFELFSCCPPLLIAATDSLHLAGMSRLQQLPLLFTIVLLARLLSSEAHHLRSHHLLPLPWLLFLRDGRRYHRCCLLTATGKL